MTPAVSADPFDLERFLAAQFAVYDAALGQVRQGRKTSHWMWFVFPQLAGLGRSEMSRRYAIGSIGEARAYLAHPVLGPRLRACTSALLQLADTSATAVFGQVDAEKLRSSLTLFAAAGDDPLFEAVLEHWFGGERDQRTLDLLATA